MVTRCLENEHNAENAIQAQDNYTITIKETLESCHFGDPVTRESLGNQDSLEPGLGLSELPLMVAITRQGKARQDKAISK
jgi:hypothetical protein